MTFLITRIDAALAAAITGIGNKLCNALGAALAGIGTKLCNALDASLYHDWDLEDTPNDGADPLADDDLGPLHAAVESSATPGGVPTTPSAAGRSMGPTRWPSVTPKKKSPAHPRPTPRRPTAANRQEARSP